MAEMESKVVIIAIGKDKPGLVANVTSVVSELMGNIEELDQVVLQGIFIMSMIVKLLNLNSSKKLSELTSKLSKQGEKIGLKIHVYPVKTLISA
ncbi:ACT domain-containing protein [Candidatus Bathyarchaeota archaeon]|nr:MAG: ACT domain-containing protein [Candidatus Bathyarchaeota archaeon]